MATKIIFMTTPNITKKDSYRKLRELDIPRLESKALIKSTYSCIGHFSGIPYSLHWALIDAKRDNLKGLEALSQIEKDISMFYIKTFNENNYNLF